MKKVLLSICLCLCVFILFGCANNPAASKIVSRCSNAWQAIGLNDQNLKPSDCVWYYRQYNDTTLLIQTAFKDWGDNTPTEKELDWLPPSGYIVTIGGIVSLFGDDDSYIGSYYTSSSDIYFAYGERRIASIKGTGVGPDTDRKIAKAHNKVNEFDFKVIMMAENNYSYISFDKYNIEQDTSYCKLTNSQINQIK